ncbi:MAG TPA: TspO/MBR family protein [Ornithinibacter sp.]|nr:TspO/MBR family protein [Ornithinibacter sp.]
MTVARVAIAVGVLVVVVGYATLAARWTSAESDWYRSLPRPRWQPPDLVFGVIWPLNFGALAVVGLAVALECPPRDGLRWLVLLTASVALALGWAHAFYRRHDLGLAAGLLGAATVLTWALVLLTHRLLPWGGWALVPYAGWLTVAASLAVGYWRLTDPRSTTAP